MGSQYSLEYSDDELFQKIHQHIQSDHGVEEAKLASRHYAQIKEGKRAVTERILTKYGVDYRKVPHPQTKADC
jgi:hypothetical protein